MQSDEHHQVTIKPLIADFSHVGVKLNSIGVSQPDFAELSKVYSIALSSIGGIALVLCAAHRGRFYPWGSAVLINPGIALAAGHVIDEFQKQISPTFEDTSLVAFGPSQTKLYAWNVKSCVFPATGDICILTIEPYYNLDNEESFCCPVISLRLPEIGERVSVVAMKSSDTAVAIGDIINMYCLLSVGEVIDVYPQKRDNMLNSPCFSCSAQFLGGMSGGPVFDSKGCLIAIVSSGFNVPENEQPISFASLAGWVWKTPVISSWYPSPGNKVSLEAMARSSLVCTDVLK